MQKKIVYILNEKAANGNALNYWDKCRRQFADLPKKPVLLSEVDDLASYIKKEKPELLVIAGGDGTINLVCQTIVHLPQKEQPILTVLPFGTGNAMAYCLGVETMGKAIKVITEQPKQITVDLMKTSIAQAPIGVFNISVGFDARVVFNRLNYRYIGLRSYVLSGVHSFISHPEKEITLTIDNSVTVRATASSLVVANCPIIGQNFVISPRARLNDGLLDCTLFSTKYAYLRNLRLRGFKHPFYSEIGKLYFKASSLVIQGEPFAQVDGDPIIYNEGITISVLPKAVTFLRNRDNEIDQYYKPFVV